MREIGDYFGLHYSRVINILGMRAATRPEAQGKTSAQMCQMMTPYDCSTPSMRGKKMKGHFSLSVTVLCAAALVGCSSGPMKQYEGKECALNFQEQGFKNYRTSVTLRGVDRKVATERLVRELGRRGFSVNDQNAAKGYVSASFDAGGSGFQLTSFIEQSGRDSQVELNYKVTGASVGSLIVPESGYLNDLCRFAEAMK